MLAFSHSKQLLQVQTCFFSLFHRLFKISDHTHKSAYSDDSANLNSHIDSVKIVQAQINEGKWKYNNSKQKPQYSHISMFTESDAFSEIRESIFKAPSFSVASQPHEVQGNSLLFSLLLCAYISFYSLYS